MSIATNLTRLRLSRGWSQARLASEAGLPRQTLQRIERGKRLDPQISTVLALARALGVSVADLTRPVASE